MPDLKSKEQTRNSQLNETGVMSSQRHQLNTEYEHQLEAGQDVLELVVFKVTTQEYAVPIRAVQEIILCQKPTTIPNSPASVEGIINLRGKIIPVVNSHIRLGIDLNYSSFNKATDVSDASTMADERIIILQVGEETIGLVVDAVSEVLNLSNADISPTPAQLSLNTQFVTGIGKYNGRLLTLLDPEKILSMKEFELTLQNA